MTEEKRIREQIAFRDYKRSMSTSAVGNVNTQRRVVTVPDAGPQVAWNEDVERRNRLYAEPSRTPHTRAYTKMTSRTLAQTGTVAPSGQVRAIKRLPQYQTPIPV